MPKHTIKSGLFTLIALLFCCLSYTAFAEDLRYSRALVADTTKILREAEANPSDANLWRLYEVMAGYKRILSRNPTFLVARALELAKRTGNTKYYNRFLISQVNSITFKEERDKNLSVVDRVVAYATKHKDDTTKAIAEYIRFKLLGLSQAAEQAVPRIQACVLEFQRLKMKNHELRARIDYAHFYGYGGSFERTIHLYNVALSMARRAKDTLNVAGILNNKANIFNNAKVFDSAYTCINECYQLAKEIKDKSGTFIARITKAEIYFNNEKYAECLALSDSCEDDPMCNDKGLISYGLWTLRGISLGKVGRWAEQESYCLKALDFIRKEGLQLEHDKLFAALARARIMQGKRLEAVAALDSHELIGGRIYNLNIARQVNEAEAKMNSREQQFKIQQLETERQNQSKINYLLIMVLVLAVSLLVVGAILGVKLYKGRQALQEQNAIIEAQNQQLAAVNQSKDKIMGIVAHDLRSPLSTLSSLSILGRDMIAESSVEEIEELFGHIKTTSDNLNAMVGNLLNWAVSLDGNLSVVPSTITLHEVCLKVIELYQDKAKAKSISLPVKVALSVEVYADFNSVFTVLRNVLNNAIKFTPNGGTVVMTAFVDGDYTTLSVQDNGKGMTEAQLNSLLKTERAKHTKGTDGEQGTGLGMLIVKELLALNHGSMTVSSGPDLGTTIRVKLPNKELPLHQSGDKPSPDKVISIIPLQVPVQG